VRQRVGILRVRRAGLLHRGQQRVALRLAQLRIERVIESGLAAHSDQRCLALASKQFSRTSPLFDHQPRRDFHFPFIISR
jgi:hypothetical protein